jgi:DNA-binding transcriptional regulator WhiA
LKNSSGFSELSSELKSLAKARLENPSMSLQELANKLGISKSCLNHRMRKLMELAGELD